MKRQGSQRQVYFRNDKWKEIDEKAILEGFQSKGCEFVKFIVNQFLAGNLVSKHSAMEDIEKTLKGFIYAYESMSESPSQKVALEIYRGLLFKVQNER